MLPVHRYPPPVLTPPRRANRWNFLTKILNKRVLILCMVLSTLWLSGPLVGKTMLASPSELNSEGRPALRLPPLQESPSPKPEEQQLWESRKVEVRKAFQHAWVSYKSKAFAADQLFASSEPGSDTHNDWSITLFDALDTMWIMGLRHDFMDAVRSLNDFHFHPPKANDYAPFFQTTIQYLGGLLSAYALSGEEILLKHADELGQILIPTFHGTELGLPAHSINVVEGQIQSFSTVAIVKVATCQLEFEYLAKLTGKPEYHELAQSVNLFSKANVNYGLSKKHWTAKNAISSGSPFTIRAVEHTGYEYLLKHWLLSGNKPARDQYLLSAARIINDFIYITPRRGLMYAREYNDSVMVHHLEHLLCFLPGMFALGAYTLDLPPHVKELHQWVAHGLMSTCEMSHVDQKTRLGPEELEMEIKKGKRWIDELHKWKVNGREGNPPGLTEPMPEADSQSYYLLRPETVESIFYMWRTTGDVRWRERGYRIFKAINQTSRPGYGFAGVEGEESANIPSYFLAEMLKYLYLLFDDTKSISLDRWVFNTEAHPMPMFSWTDPERSFFNISAF